MRPETAYQIVRNGMKVFYYSRDTMPKHRLLDKRFEQAVDVCLRVAQQDEDPEYKTTNAYYEIDGIDDILTNLHYISDRWNCVGRLFYLKDVINYMRNENGSSN